MWPGGMMVVAGCNVGEDARVEKSDPQEYAWSCVVRNRMNEKQALRGDKCV